MAQEMVLGAYNLGNNFPIYGRAYQYVRADDQGPSFKRVDITLSGFLEGDNHAEVMSLYSALKTGLDVGDETTFKFIDNAVTIHNDQKVYIESYNEPEDTEFAKVGVGDYQIGLYYFEDTTDTSGITCSYGPYTFEKVPKWGRVITANRERSSARYRGSTAKIGLSGHLFAADHAALAVKIQALESAFQSDQILVYGAFSNSCSAMRCTIEEVVPRNIAFYSIELEYDIGQIIDMKRRITISRMHNNPVITEQPFCNRRTIEEMNRSGQTIQYHFDIRAQTLTNARELLSIEASNTIEPGGIEMQGGTEVWDIEDQGHVTLDCTKFYENGVIGNLAGT